MTSKDDHYETMREIGQHLGMTSHDVGRVLKTAGWRTTDGSPSFAVRDSGWVTTYSLDGGGYAWKWKTSVVRELLQRWQKENLASSEKKQGL
jgi:hypothetical protein